MLCFDKCNRSFFPLPHSRVIAKLHHSNQLFLHYLLPLLHNISVNENVNQMSTTNLAICFAPSLLQPDSSLDVIKNEAPTLVDFLIKYATELYNNELPELYKLPGTTRASSDDLASSIELVPVKNEPVKLGSDFGRHHRRNFSMDTNTSASEDSVDETETESDISPRKIPIHHTASDSQIEERSGPKGLAHLLGQGRIDDCNSDMDEGDEDEELVSPSYESPNRWGRHGPGSFNKGRVRHKSGDSITSMGRRRSIATQNTNGLPLRRQYSPELDVIQAPPESPSSSHSGSSHDYASKFSHPEGGSGRSGYRSDGGTRHIKKRRIPRYSSSFSKQSDRKYEAQMPMSTSSSFYDSLLPQDRGRSQSFGTGNIHRVGNEASHVHTAIPSSSLAPIARNSSNRGSNSSSSGQNQPGAGKVSVVASLSQGSGNGRRSASPDPVALLESGPMDKLSRDVVKQAISCRFGISSMDWPPTVSRHSQHTPGITVSRMDKDQPRTDSKSTPGREGAITDYPYKLQPYRNEVPLSSKPSKTRTVLDSRKVPEILDYDDRPEAEQHLHDYKLLSGGRGLFGTEPVQAGHMYQPEGGSRLTINSAGYNSDTESSPSRTLNRHKDKMQEVTSPGLPQSSRMLPSRYNTKTSFELESSKTQSPLTPSSSSAIAGKEEYRSRAESLDARLTRSIGPLPNSRSKFTSSIENAESVSRSRASTVAHGTYREQKEQEAVSSHLSEKGLKNQPDQSKAKPGLLDNLREEEVTSGREEMWREVERARHSPSEKRQAAEELAKNISWAQSREMRKKKQTSPPVAANIGLARLSPSEAQRKSRSMPDHHRRVVARTAASPQQVKTVRVVKYELPTPKKTRRINLRACNK